MGQEAREQLPSVDRKRDRLAVGAAILFAIVFEAVWMLPRPVTGRTVADVTWSDLSFDPVTGHSYVEIEGRLPDGRLVSIGTLSRDAPAPGTTITLDIRKSALGFTSYRYGPAAPSSGVDGMGPAL